MSLRSTLLILKKMINLLPYQALTTKIIKTMGVHIKILSKRPKTCQKPFKLKFQLTILIDIF